MSGAVFFFSLIGYALLAMLAFPRLKAGPALLSGLCAMLFLSYVLVILLQWMIPASYLLLIAGWMFLFWAGEISVPGCVPWDFAISCCCVWRLCWSRATR